jgi:site-specific DNA-methyltransferase (adenine-specific)
MNKTPRAPFNRTLDISSEDIADYAKQLLQIDKPVKAEKLYGKILHMDIFDAVKYLPDSFVDLMFIDPPYNMSKKFNSSVFKEMGLHDYELWLDSWLKEIKRLMKPEASLYICGDWKSSPAIYNIASRYFIVQNRITWEREKDIWFFTMSDKFTFNIDDVKIKRKVLAPYKTGKGEPKDWENDGNGSFRVTHPSNIWTDITIPFWSMPENTDHPTQKPEKLLAKIILASSNPGDLVFDPFIGSGTTAVTAKKLGRKYSGVEIDELFCCLTAKRLELAEKNKVIQGFDDGVFWERNTLSDRAKKNKINR